MEGFPCDGTEDQQRAEAKRGMTRGVGWFNACCHEGGWSDDCGEGRRSKSTWAVWLWQPVTGGRDRDFKHHTCSCFSFLISNTLKNCFAFCFSVLSLIWFFTNYIQSVLELFLFYNYFLLHDLKTLKWNENWFWGFFIRYVLHLCDNIVRPNNDQKVVLQFWSILLYS